ncbi:MAG: DUF1887 family CARF protein [Rhodocyclaceae bacterium]|nr:DUF1887 family CARF protein [Rhodocyclaceae bacterium]
MRHLVLVSDQPTPSLAPLLDPAIGAQAAILAHAPERARHARWLAGVLARQGVPCTLWPLQDGFDLEATRADFAALAQRYAEGLAVNVTGGAKPMTIAAWETFARAQDRVYYIDIRRDCVRWLRPTLPETPLADCMKLDLYIPAHGLRVAPHRPLRRQMPTAERLAQARALLEDVARACSRYVSEGGDWLEELVFAEVAAIARADAKIQDYARQFVIDDDGEAGARVENEIDVCVLRDNTLYLIECKTGQSGRGGAASDALYKLAQQVHALGGLRGRGIFVTSESLSPQLRARAQALRITPVERAHLRALRATLAHALQTGFC